MRLLIKQQVLSGLVAHVPDGQGAPLCSSRLRLDTWHIEDRRVTSQVICHNCLHVLTKAQRSNPTPHLT